MASSVSLDAASDPLAEGTLPTVLVSSTTTVASPTSTEEGRAQDVARNPAGAYQLFRIGDAVAARNTHAAVYDALRLVRTL